MENVNSSKEIGYWSRNIKNEYEKINRKFNLKKSKDIKFVMIV